MKTEIIAITDRSGSMQTIASDVIGGYNRFVQEQCAQEGEARMTYIQFDDKYEVVYQGKPIRQAPLLDGQTFQPRGSTALYDAIGRTLAEQGERIAKEGWAEQVIVTIITDGQENASREFSQVAVKALIDAAKLRNWHFVFLAANQDAFVTASGMGISGATTRNFTADSAGATMAYASTSALVGSLRSDPNSVYRTE